jgi:hypothetical protein
VRPGSPVFLGTFTALAANEHGCLVEAALYSVELTGTIRASSEIEEAIWFIPTNRTTLSLHRLLEKLCCRSRRTASAPGREPLPDSLTHTSMPCAGCTA